MSSILSDLVRDSRLDTTFAGGITQHVAYASDSRRRRIRLEESWKRQRALGNGTYGRVWLETCISGSKNGQLRAVKEIAKPQGSQSSSDIDYSRELEAIAKFSHDKYVHCFVRSLGWYESEDAIFIAMEFFGHGDLQKYLFQAMPEPEVKEITSQLVEGLGFMHENYFAHRDLKPGNILVFNPGPDWWVKIGDFGITKRAEEGSTALRTTIGTRGYLAPEVIGVFHSSMRGREASEPGNREPLSYTFAVDIWALGEVAFRLMTNESAFPTPSDLFDYVVYSKAFPRQVLQRYHASPACCGFIEKAMSPAPQNRPAALEAAKLPWMQGLSKTFSFDTEQVESSSSGVPSNIDLLQASVPNKALSLSSDISTMPSSSIVPRPDFDLAERGISDPVLPFVDTAKWTTASPGTADNWSVSRPDVAPEKNTYLSAASAEWSTNASEPTALNETTRPRSSQLSDTSAETRDKTQSPSPAKAHDSLASAAVDRSSVISTPAEVETPREVYSPNPEKRRNRIFGGLFRRKPKTTETTAAAVGVFGVPLSISTAYAKVTISLLDKNGSSYVYGYIPIATGKCGVFLKEKATEVKDIFTIPGNAKHVKELVTIFDSPDRYGKGFFWDGYTVYDAATVFLRFLTDLPEPVVPLYLYEKFREPLRDATKPGETGDPQFADGFDTAGAIIKYQQLMKEELPPPNRYLFEYLLDILAVFASKAEANQMTSQRLATVFQPGMLAHPEHAITAHERRLNEIVIFFLLENQEHFLLGSQPKPATPPSSDTVSVAAESIVEHGSIRRNKSVSSIWSRYQEGPHVQRRPSISTMSSGQMTRSNSVPTRRAPPRQ